MVSSEIVLHQRNRGKSLTSDVLPICTFLYIEVNSKLHKFNTTISVHHHRIPASLMCDGQNPAFDSRLELIKAGDIELNPGPSTECHVCQEKLGTKGKLMCSFLGCMFPCHRREKCSGVSPTQHHNGSAPTTEPNHNLPLIAMCARRSLGAVENLSGAPPLTAFLGVTNGKTAAGSANTTSKRHNGSAPTTEPNRYDWKTFWMSSVLSATLPS